MVRTPLFQGGDWGSNPHGKTIYSELVQLVERLTVTQVVAGSSPALGAKYAAVA